MKIIGIKFQNLNSLKGIHEIRFDKPPFNGNSLFAITGSTGAGKTTILDAITVALYGRVHRHTKNANESMTRHTNESFSEVEFEVQNNIYRSRWEQKRAGKRAANEFLSPKMELSNALTGEIIASHPLVKVQQEIIDVCGLDYNQFLRSVVLSQGDFTRFLKASESERSELLEKLTDTGIYSQISSFVFEKTKSESNLLQQLKAKLDDQIFLTDLELADFEEQLVALGKREKSQLQEKEATSNQLQWLVQIGKLHEKARSLDVEYDDFQRKYDSLAPLFQRLTRHKELSAFRPLMVEVDNNQKNIAGIDESINQIDAEIVTLNDLFVETNSRFVEAETTYLSVEKEKNEAEPLIAEAEKLDALIESKMHQVNKAQDSVTNVNQQVEQLQNDITDRKSQIELLVAETERLAQWQKAHRQDETLQSVIPIFIDDLGKIEMESERVNQARQEHEKLKSQEAEAKAALSQLKEKREINQQSLSDLSKQIGTLEQEMLLALSGKSVEDWENEATMLPGLISLCERQFELSGMIAQSDQSLQEITQKQQQLNIQQQEQSKSLKILTEEWQREKDYLVVLQENARMQLLIQKYEADRKELRDGVACPLCGSIHHPFVASSSPEDNPDYELRQAEQQRKVDGLMEKINHTKISLQNIENLLQTAGEQKDRWMADKETHLKSFHQNNTSLPKPLDENNPVIIRAIIKSKKELQAQNNIELAKIRNLDRKRHEWEAQAAKTKEGSIRLEGENKQSEQHIIAINQSLARIDTSIKQTEKAVQSLQEKIICSLESYQLTFRLADGREILSTLQKRLETYLQTNDELKCKNEDLAVKQSDLQYKVKSLTEKQFETKHLTEELIQRQDEYKQLQKRRASVLGDKSPGEERKRLAHTFLSIRETCDKLRIEVSENKQKAEIAKSRMKQLTFDKTRLLEDEGRLSKQLLESLQPVGINSIDELRYGLMPEEEAKNADKLYQETEKEKTALVRLRNETRTELDQEKNKNLTTEPQEKLESALTDLEKSISELNQEMGRIREIIRVDGQRKNEYRKLADDIAAQQKEVDRWKKLSELIGSADGKKFSRFAQGLTLEQLVGLANKHIKNFTDRYVIYKTPDKDLDLQIMDHYQADIVRPMASLSGGESFLVSLALALGLSELASRKTQINSLFIDEGFGMLDAETLDTAILALENLQISGKTIGIISHVETLKERIGIQIQVEKKQGGYSKIKIVAFGQEYQK